MDPFESPWFYALLVVLASAAGIRIAAASLASGVIAYLLAIAMRSVAAAINGSFAGFPSVSVALTGTLGYWVLLGERTTLRRAVSFLIILSLVVTHRIFVGAHTVVEALGALAVVALALIPVRIVASYRRPTVITAESKLASWPSRAFLPSERSERWTRAEVADRYPGAVSPLFSELFFPSVSRAVQRMIRTLRIGKPDTIISYRVERGFVLSNMGLWALRLPRVCRRFLTIRRDAIEYFKNQYPKAKEEFWKEQHKLDAQVRATGGSVTEAHSRLGECLAHFESWMFQHSLSLFSLTFASYYLRLFLGLHFPRSGKKLILALPRGQRTPSVEDAIRLSELGHLLDPHSDSWEDLTGQAASLAAALLERAGNRAASYDFTQPTWRENPEAILKLARSIARSEEPPEVQLAVLQRQGEEAQAIVRTRIRRLHPFAGRRLSDDIVYLSRATHLIKEDRQLQMAAAWGLVREAVLAIGRALVSSGKLEEPSDVFFLTTLDLVAVIRQQGDARTLRPEVDLKISAQHRREVFRQLGTLDPSDLGAEAAVLELPARLRFGSKVSNDTFRGKYALPGVVCARATVIRSLDEFGAMESGRILVCPMTNPHWDVLFSMAKGIVVERGGLFSHAMLKASEFGLPAIVGVPGVLARVATGDHLKLDGNARVLHIGVGDG